MSETVLVVSKKHISCEEPFIIADASSLVQSHMEIDTGELDRILESLENGENDNLAYEQMQRCEQMKEISDRIIIDNEAVNKTIMSIINLNIK